MRLPNKQWYVWYYYTLNMNTGDVKFCAYRRSFIAQPQYCVTNRDFSDFKAKYLQTNSDWRIIDSGYVLESSLKTLKYFKTLTPRIDGSSTVYSSAISDS